jgi:hypothetical protein
MVDILKAVKCLKGAEVEAIKSGHTSVLLTAPNISNKVELLLARDVNITAGTTPLHLAAQNGHATVVKTLLEVRGIATEAVDEFNQTPLLLAASAGHEAVVRLLLGADGVARAVSFATAIPHRTTEGMRFAWTRQHRQDAASYRLCPSSQVRL